MKNPSIFVIGDSISCYYGKYLKEMLQGLFRVYLDNVHFNEDAAAQQAAFIDGHLAAFRTRACPNAGPWRGALCPSRR